MGKKILVVDDEVDIVEQLRLRLEYSGYQVFEANNGEQALEKVRLEGPDLVILDVMMPPPNGFQVCRMLKDDPEFKHIPIIMLTAKSTDSDQFWGMESGADDYITKPYNAEELMKKISGLIGG